MARKKSEKPESDKPESDKPDGDNPETEKPESEKAESEKAKTEKPERRKGQTPKRATPEGQTTLSSEGFFEPFNIDDIPWQRPPGSTMFKRLGRFGGGTQVGVGIDVLKPGQYSNPFHYHLREEEHILILKGSATLVLGSGRYVMQERGYCCFPAGQRAGHHLFNHTDQNCVFITIGDNKPDDIACFPKSGKARIKATGKLVPMAEI